MPRPLLHQFIFLAHAWPPSLDVFPVVVRTPGARPDDKFEIQDAE